MGQEILTSTGHVGVSRRSCNRLYINGTFSNDPQLIGNDFARLCRIGEKQPDNKYSRRVARGIVGKDVYPTQHTEVFLPLAEFTGDGSALTYLAQNSSTRFSQTPIDTILQETSTYKNGHTAPLENISKMLNEGFTFSNKISETQIDQLQELWGHTFGWSKEEIINLNSRLQANIDKPPTERDVWLSIVQKDGNIISAAMAERLTLQGENGRKIDLVESTEWVTKKGFEKNGYMTATLNYLNAQIIHDLQESQNGLPIIFAECNFATRADISGNKVGFKIPERSHATQILIQNVSVNDGFSKQFGPFRDFLFMYLPVTTIEQNYSPQQVEEITNLVK